MVAHSPDSRKAKNDYADGWLAINQLIRSDGSWSGRERNVFYLNLGDGHFIDLSGVAGLDFPEDGRAYAVLDLDGDGDLDLILKNRNAPQLRLLRNDTETGNHSIAFELNGRPPDLSPFFEGERVSGGEGPLSTEADPQTPSPPVGERARGEGVGPSTNSGSRLRSDRTSTSTKFTSRDAVGAAITVETSSGSRTKYVQIGSGFLSQSSRRVYFGLGREPEVQRMLVTWPTGRVQIINSPPVDHLVTIVEGEPEFRARPFRRGISDQRSCAPQSVPQPSAVAEGYTILDPVPAPPFELQALDGQLVRSQEFAGRPMILNFWATWCAPCQEEMRLWKEHYPTFRRAGAELIALSVDEPQERAAVEQFVRERELPFPVLHMDKQILERYNTFYRYLFERRRDLEIPTTFLLNTQGLLVKLYRGIVPIEQLLADLGAAQHAPQELARTALPYPGRRFLGGFARDYYQLGGAFFQRQQIDDAGFYLAQAVERSPADAESWDNLGVARAQQGRLKEAIAAFERALELHPNYASAHFNRGIAYLRLKKPEAAEAAFARAAALAPEDSEKQLQYGMVLADNGKLQEAIPVLENYLVLQPDDARTENDLGALYATTGSPLNALEHFKKATEIDPTYQAAFRNLGIAYLEQRMAFRATAALERARDLNPRDAESLLALADAYLQSGRAEEAERSLEQVLEIQPAHPKAGEILEQLRRGSPR